MTGRQESCVAATMTKAVGGMTGVLGEMDTLEKAAMGDEDDPSLSSIAIWRYDLAGSPMIPEQKHFMFCISL